MKASRLFQFRNPLFWVFVLLNILSSVITYLLRTYTFTTAVMLMLTGFAFANVIVGWRIALRLMRE